MKIPERISWAAELLRLERGMRVLEIGCGRGHAARVLTPALGVNGYVGVDRSKVAIQAARKLNAEAEGRGIARFVLGEFGAAHVGSRPFERVLAINVNAFWTDDGEAGAMALPLLKKNGWLLLVYELPSPAKLDEVEARLETNLRGAGFGLMSSTRERGKAWIAMWGRRG